MFSPVDCCDGAASEDTTDGVSGEGSNDDAEQRTVKPRKGRGLEVELRADEGSQTGKEDDDKESQQLDHATGDAREPRPFHAASSSRDGRTYSLKISARWGPNRSPDRPVLGCAGPY